MSRAYAWFAAVFLLLQGVSTLLARLIPAVDATVPALLEHTKMQPAHSVLHITTAFVAFTALAAGTRASHRFALWFGAFYAALAVVGAATGSSLGLGLQAFDHPFHLLLGAMGIGASWLDARRHRAGRGAGR